MIALLDLYKSPRLVVSNLTLADMIIVEIPGYILSNGVIAGPLRKTSPCNQ
jgi:hypothetical protein